MNNNIYKDERNIYNDERHRYKDSEAQHDIDKINMFLFGYNGKDGLYEDITNIKKDIRYIYIILITIVIFMAGIFGERFISIIK